jgi:triphosphatase
VSNLAEPQSGPEYDVNAAGREIELKFLLAEADFKAARQWAGLDWNAPPPRARRLKSVYFDTVEDDLARRGMVLRVRNHGRRYVMTCKWQDGAGGGLFERGEVEVVMAAAEPEPALLREDIAAAIAALIGDRKLLPVCVTEVKRIAYLVRNGASEIEVAFDTGVIEAGERRERVCEVEMELKSGEPAALYDLGIAFAEAFPARIGCLSKSERGLLLRSGKAPPVIRATVALEGAPTVDAAIGVLMNACITQFIGNFPAFATGDRVKAVHQMRVAMRRLRSVLGLFNRAFPNAAFAGFREAARDIAAAMGEARDWDVFIALIEHGPSAAFPAEPGFAAVLQQAAKHRDAGYAATENLLTSAGTTRFVLALQAFMARHGWRNMLSDEALPRLTAPARAFAAGNLARLHHKLLRRGKHFSKLSPHYRHELRKDLKKIRYIADLFDGVLEAGKYTHSASKLQDELGFFNDLVAAQAMAARLRTGDDVAVSRAVGIVMGWCAHGAAGDDAGLRGAWKDFRKVKVVS